MTVDVRTAESATEGPWAEVLDLGPLWSGGAPLPHVVSGSFAAVLVCRADAPDPAWDGNYVSVVSPGDDEPSPLLVYTFRNFYSITFGGMTDDVMHGHPLYDRELEFYRPHLVHNSPWLAEEQRINSVHEQYSAERFARLRHYFLAFHDEMFEALAPGVDVRLVTSSIAEQLREASDVRVRGGT